MRSAHSAHDGTMAESAKRSCLFTWAVNLQDAPVVDALPPLPITDETGIGLRILDGYATTGDVQEDLKKISDLLQSYQILIKADDAMPFASNLDMAAAFRGENAHRTAFLPQQHQAFDKAGEFVDRWGKPLFFHVQSATRIEIRSAGPDREMWTEDDVQLNPKGEFAVGLQK